MDGSEEKCLPCKKTAPMIAKDSLYKAGTTCSNSSKKVGYTKCVYYNKLEMWANAQRHGRPAEYRWRPLFNAAVWLTPTTRCRAVTLPRHETS